MTLTNLSLTQIAGLWARERPLYLDVEEGGRPRRIRLRGCRMKQGGKFEVKVSRDGKAAKWEEADRAKIVCAY